MTAEVEYLDLDDVLHLAGMVLGHPPPVRDIGLLGAAIARPQTTTFGEDAYPDLWHKAASLMQSLLKNHALVDGNKRVAWMATAVFLELRGVDMAAAGNDDVFRTVTEVAAGDLDVEEIARRLEALAFGS